MWVLPVYELCFVADLFILNSIEFWSGENPALASEVKVVDGKDAKYLVARNEGGYTITNMTTKQVTRFNFNAEDNSWSLENNGQEVKLFTFVDDTHVDDRYITAIIKNRDCKLFRINGIGNHIHMLVGLSSSIALSDLVRDIKQGSSKWAKQQVYFPNFRGWGKEYGAFSCSIRDKDAIINYINNQRVHHRQKSFEQEYQDMIERSGLGWSEFRLT